MMSLAPIAESLKPLPAHDNDEAPATSSIALVRYGAVPEVARCDSAAAGAVNRSDSVVIKTSRGEQLATVLQILTRSAEPRPAHLTVEQETAAASFDVLRIASNEDLEKSREQRRRVENEFPHWQQRISEWELDIQLVDVEYTLDGNCILYVLNERGPDCTKLALRAAAAGLGIVSVQPVSAEGLVTLPASVSTNPSQCGSSGGSCGCH